MSGRLLLVDGPRHGDTIQLEGDPGEQIYVATLVVFTAPPDRDCLRPDQPTHQYRRLFRTDRDTFVYVWEGEVR